MNQNIQKLVNALKSGLYKQCTKRLYIVEQDTLKETYCVLGVATKVYCNTTGENFGEILKKDGDRILSEKVKKWYGFSGNLGGFNQNTNKYNTIASLNDEGMSFDELANFIESEPPGLFNV